MKKWKLAASFIALPIVLMLFGCGGGSSNNISTKSVSGVAAAGAPLSGSVYLKDSSTPATELSTTIAPDGSFSFDISGLKAPFLLKAIGTANGNDLTLFSLASASGIANINPLSNLAIILSCDGEELTDLYESPDPLKMKSISISLPTVVSKLQTTLHPALSQFGAAEINFISDTYSAKHQGLDLLLDLLTISINNGSVTITDKTSNNSVQTPTSSFLNSIINIVPIIQSKLLGSTYILPFNASAIVKENIRFTAIVVGTSNQQVNWSVIEDNGGTITSAGLYTAPSSAGTYHVKTVTAFGTSTINSITVTATSHPPSTVLLYNITDLGGFFWATGINNMGQVVGFTSSGGYHGVIYSNGKFTDIGVLPGDAASYANGINDTGQVVGESTNINNSYRAFLYSNGTMTNLGTLGGASISPTGINHSGQIVGFSYGNRHAFLYSKGKMTDLGTPPGYVSSQATSINNSGQVIGTCAPISGPTHAFIYSGGIMTDIGTLPGGSVSYAIGINDSGQVVGYSDVNSYGLSHAFLYRNGNMIDIGTLSGYPSSAAYGINSYGQIVGSSAFFSDNRAFIYSDGKMTDLNSLIPSGTGWELFSASYINDLGQIVGTGNLSYLGNHTFLLTPAVTAP